MFKSIAKTVFLFTLITLLIACGSSATNVTSVPASPTAIPPTATLAPLPAAPTQNPISPTDAPEPQAPSPSGPTFSENAYLGQNPPGKTPRLFAPGIISVDANFEHSAAVFSPDKHEVFWITNVDWYTDERVVGNQRLYHMKMVDGTWTAPQIAPFTENIQVPVQRPIFSPDGNKLYIEYSSDPNRESDADIYVVERTGEGWSEPVPVSPLINSPAIERLHCVTADGSLYFSRDPFTANEEIFVSRFVNGAFTEPEKLGKSYNSDDYELAILIAPNQEYMLVEQMNTQQSSSKLMISYKKADGSWTDRIRTHYECGGFLALSPDGDYLFFLGHSGIYWVSTSFIDDLKPPTVERSPPTSETIISPDTVDQIVQRQSLSGHTDLVYDLAFTPDGRFLASGSADGTVRLWDLTSGQTIHTLRHSGGVCRLAMSPDGGLLASGGLDRSVKLWDLETGQAVHTFGGYEGAVCGLDFSPDGALLATGSVDQSVKLWDVASKQLCYTLAGHTSAVFSVAFAPDGAWLASGSARPELHIKLWDVESGQEVHTLTGQETDAHDLTFSPHGSLLAAVGPMAEAKLWDVASGQVVQDLQGHNGNVFGAAFSTDGSLLASSADDGTVKLWNVETGQALRALRPDGEGLAVAFSPDGSLLACTDADNQVHLWGVPPHAPPTATPVPPTPRPSPQPTADTGERILFVGNSHTFMNDLPGTFAELARSGGHEVSVDSSAMGGYTLERHVRDRNTQEKLDRADWDFVVLQESTLIFTEESTRNTQMAPAVRELEEKIRSQGAQTILTLMWASVEAVDEEGLDHFALEQAQATAALQQLVQGLDVFIAPVGPAWEKSLRQRSELKLWGSDNHHASPAGTYLMACVLYATIYQESPVGLSFTAGLPEETTLFLQEIAQGVTKLNTDTPIALPPTPTPTATPLPPLSGSGGGIIALASDRDGDMAIYAMNADGSDARRMAGPNPGGFCCCPSWSPDGQRIAYPIIQSGSHGAVEVWVTTLDGSESICVSETISKEILGFPWPYPTWSPDGTQIAFHAATKLAGADTESTIYIVQADGSGVAQAIPLTYVVSGLTWSPQGDQLLFLGGGSGDGMDARVLSIEGAEITEVYTGVWSADWSSDGTDIIVAPNQGEEVIILESDGTSRSISLPEGTRLAFVDWSPDGAYIAVGSFPQFRHKIVALHVIAAETGERVKLIEDKGDIYRPNWSPDGNRLLFTSADTNRPGQWPYASLWSYNATSNTLRRLTRGQVHDGAGVWSLQTTPTTTATPQPSLGSSDSEAIVFSSYRDGNEEIYVMNADGSDQRNITHHSTSDDTDPQWSPDGSQIAFASTRNDREDIYVMNADGSNVRQLTHHSAIDADPTWSPDGTRVAFVSLRDGNVEIYVVNADGSNLQRLTQNNCNDFEIDWSPNGTHIAVSSKRGVYGNIYLVNVQAALQDPAGSEPQQITATDAHDAFPTWSPDGSRIAFISNREGQGNWEIYVMDADGSNQVRLTYTDAIEGPPSWSPDGTQIVFESNRDGDFEIYIMAADGTHVRRLTDNSVHDRNPDWRPNTTTPSNVMNLWRLPERNCQ